MRIHLEERAPGVELPSLEGLLVSRRRREYVLALPALLVAEGGNPQALEARYAVIPRERVAFYEVIG